MLDAVLLASIVAFGASRALKRVPTAVDLGTKYLKRRSLFGKVINVNDGDDFRFFHTPGGVLGGWGWLRSLPPTGKRGIPSIHIRLCGIDAPEGPNFGRPGQMYHKEALNWLRKYILGRNVRVYPLSKDQYNRVVADVYVRRWGIKHNVSAEILKSGWAVVYEAKTGAEFAGHEEWFRKLEAKSRNHKRGMFIKGKVETPGEYKQKYRV